MIEVWKDIPGFEGRYAVSTHGRVKSLNRTVRIGRAYRSIEERILKPKSSTHYPQVEMSRKICLIHRLVAIAFIPNPDRLKTVNHIDRDRNNNHVSNLEWCSQLENNLHAIRSGKNFMRGDDHYRRIRKMNPDTKKWEVK